MNTHKAKVGRRIRYLRLSRGWNQEELAGQVGIHRGHLSQIERGINFPRPRNLLKLAEVLGAKVEEFLEGGEIE